MKKPVQPDSLDGAPLRYAPTNELGVVFLFAHLAKRWRLRIDSIQAAFPDCVAIQKTQKGEKRIRIEFEYKSRNFRSHKHDARKCDWIVCWEHNWPDAPRNLQIVELRREFGLGFNVWIVPAGDRFKEAIAQHDRDGRWSLPSQCHKGDLVLSWFTHPDKCIEHIFVAMDRARKMPANWKKGTDYMGPIQRVCRLKAPIFWEDLRRHRALSTAPFVRAQMQGRPNATEYWPYLYDIIVRRNPTAKSRLRKYAPESL